MNFYYYYKKTCYMLDKHDKLIFICGLMYALCWLLVAPIEFTGDSQDYLGLAHMLLGKSADGMMPPIYRTPGYPLLLILTGAVTPGTFTPLLLIQALFAALTPIFIYRILCPYSQRMALVSTLITILIGITTVHVSQIMSEQLFIILLFFGLSLTIKIINKTNLSSNSFYWLGVTFAVMNSVRPIAWPIFWLFMIIITWALWREKLLLKLWKNIASTALLFMALMSIWAIAYDALFSIGAQYSPLTPLKAGSDSRLDCYLYELPFNEAYFAPWKQRVEHITEDPASFGNLHDRPEMTKIYNIILKYIIKNKKTIWAENSSYSYQLYGKYKNQPEQLARQIFASPNYTYANFIRVAMEKSTSNKERLSLYYNAAKEVGRNWPQRWFELWKQTPFLSFTGPSSGAGVNQFLLAYTSLHHFLKTHDDNSYRSSNSSIVNNNNGPATRFLYDTLTSALKNNPELWKGTGDPFGLYIDKPEALPNYLISKPSQGHAWSIEVILWDLMGYTTMSHLLNEVANEAFSIQKEARVLRSWVMTLMVAAGPGYANFDDLRPELAPINFWRTIETPLLSHLQKKELQITNQFHQKTNVIYLKIMQFGYFLFYLCKPFFLFIGIASFAVLWCCKRSLIIPLILMLPYLISTIIYGMLFNDQPRYTDPTLLLPFIVTCIALPDYLCIWNGRRKKNIDALKIYYRQTNF
ncbi:MAG: hypothetical protein Q8R83_07510 [Legionellaceae bacterium]|nr:hypothetical protein [Legionellaceae bacterium]